MPTYRITAPRKMGRVEEGQSFIVVSRTTGTKFGPDASDIEEVLYINGYKEQGGGSAISFRSTGNWEYEVISDDTYPAWNEQHEKYEAEIKKDKASSRRDDESKAKASSRHDDESKAKAARNKAKKNGGGSSGCCSICKCILGILGCILPGILGEWAEKAINAEDVIDKVSDITD